MIESQQLIDRFDWDCGATHSKSDDEILLEKIENEKQEKHEMKWAEMLDDWDFWITNKRTKVDSRIRKGVPDAFRSRLWCILTDTEKFRANASFSYKEVLDKPPLGIYREIEMDVTRTFYFSEYFAKDEVRNSLKNVLYANAQIDREVEYISGVSFIAATILMYLDDETALWAFHNTMTGERTMHRDFVIKGNPRLGLATKMLRKLLLDKYPQIVTHLDSLNFDFLMFSYSWFIPAFTNFHWFIEMHLRVFDMYLFCSLQALLTFGLVIFSIHSDILTTGSYEEVAMVLVHPNESPIMKNWRCVLKKFDELWVDDDVYQTLLTKA